MSRQCTSRKSEEPRQWNQKHGLPRAQCLAEIRGHFASYVSIQLRSGQRQIVSGPEARSAALTPLRRCAGQISSHCRLSSEFRSRVYKDSLYEFSLTPRFSPGILKESDVAHGLFRLARGMATLLARQPTDFLLRPFSLWPSEFGLRPSSRRPICRDYLLLLSQRCSRTICCSSAAG